MCGRDRFRLLGNVEETILYFNFTKTMTITSITSTALDQAYGIGSTIAITLNFSEAATLAGGPLTLTLSSGTEVTIAPFSQQMSATAIYTVSSGQVSSDLDVAGIFLNGATLKNGNGDNVSLDVLTGFGLGNTRSIVVDGIAPKVGEATIFNNPNTFATGSTPASIAVGDFNGDGRADMAIGNYTSNDVSVLLGDGSGGFSAQTTFTTGLAPRAVAVSDFNGDSKADLAIANKSSDNISVLLGDGSGGFSPQSTFATGMAPFSITVGDFNGDNHSDMATADYDTDTVSVLLGDGSGGFSERNSFAVGARPRTFAIGDLNEDSKPDLVTAN
jgi:trimeric autotransporter adhesin